MNEWRALSVAVAAVAAAALLLGSQPAGQAARAADPAPDGAPRVFTSAELRESAARKELRLVIVGKVYDVSKGKQYYAEGSGYAGFAQGVDATREFLTATFESTDDDLSNLEALAPRECHGVEHWVRFYEEHEHYAYLGVLNARFYDAAGRPTAQHAAFRACVAAAEAGIAAVREALEAAPECEFARGDAADPRRSVRCAPPLVPRKVELPDEGARCACVQAPEGEGGGGGAKEAWPELQVYEGNGWRCAASASSCRLGREPT